MLLEKTFSESIRIIDLQYNFSLNSVLCFFVMQANALLVCLT